MIPNNFTAYNSQGYPRPDDFVDPSEKQSNPKWCHQYAQFIYAQFMNGSSSITSAMRDKIEKRYKYAEGNQDTDVYKTRFLDDANTRPNIPIEGSDIDGKSTVKGQNEGFANIDFESIFSPLPKYVNNIIGIMQNQDHDIQIKAIDEKSGNLKDEIKYLLYAKKELFEELQLFNKAFQLQDPSEKVPLPESLEELEMFSQMGMFKLPYEIGMKKAINHTDELSRLRELKDDLIYDLVCNNMCCTETYVDTNGYVKHDHVPLFDVIIEGSKKRNHSDSSYCARIKWLTAADLKEETGWDDDKIRQMISKYANTYGNPSYDPAKLDDRSFSLSSFRIPVLRCYWKSVDSIIETERKKGNKTMIYQEEWKGKRPRFYNNDNRKSTRTDVHTLYHCNWVIDMPEDYVYEYGRPNNLPYNYESKEVELPIHFYKGRGRSIIDLMMIIADDIQFTYLKLQAAIIQAPPPGISFDIGVLENLTLDGSNNITVKDAIRLYSQKGSFVYRLSPSTLNTPTSRSRPIEELRGGLGTAITDAMNAMEMFYHSLDVLSGIDAITSANQSPLPEQGKGVTEIAVAATHNTLKHLYAAYLSMKESQTKCAAYYIQALTYLYRDNINDNPYYKVIGKTNLLSIITAGEYPPVCYGFFAKAVPSDNIKNEIIGAARDAMKSGRNGKPVITYSEYLFIVEHLDTYDGVGWARVFLAKKEQQHMVEEAEAARAAQENNAMIAKEQEQAKAESERVRIEYKLKSDKDLATHKTNELIRLEEAKADNLIRVKKETGDIGISN